VPKISGHAQPFITLDRVTIRVRDLRLFSGASWEIASGQNWAVIGPNGAGKTSLVRALAGQVPVVDGNIKYHAPGLVPSAVGYLSFESHQNLIAREEVRDDSRFFSGDFDSFLSVRHLLLSVVPTSGFQTPALDRVGDRLEIAGLLDRPVRRLSTGEIRRVLIAREILKSPRLLILDEPFEGVDTQGRRRIKALIRTLIEGQIPVILVTHRLAEIPSAVSHILAVNKGGIVFQGKRPATLNRQDLERLYAPEKRPEIALPVRPQPVICSYRAFGRVLIEAAKTYGCRAVGIEIDKARAALARENVERAGVSDKVEIITGDMFKVDVSDADVIVLYQFPDKQAKLGDKLFNARAVVSYSHRIPDVKNVKWHVERGGKEYFFYIWEPRIRWPED